MNATVPASAPAPALLPLATAQRYAQHIANRIAPFCHHWQIAGSIRRMRPHCADVDIVCVPKVEEQRDMLGQVVWRSNLCWNDLVAFVHERNPSGSKLRTPYFISGGEREGKQIIIQFDKCQADIWFAETYNFGSRLLCRTGSKEHNVWLASRLGDRGLHWFPYQGIAKLDALRGTDYHSPGAADRAREKGLILPAQTEADLYHYAGLSLIEPINRELSWLKSRIDSGLP